jgi:hypothetical protein
MCSPLWAVNDFTNDPGTELWGFENDLLGDIGSNDFTGVNEDFVTGGEQKIGTYALRINVNDTVSIADADMDADFVFKNGVMGDFTVGMWHYPFGDDGGEDYLFIKGWLGNGDAVFKIYMNNDNKLVADQGHNGGASEESTTASTSAITNSVDYYWIGFTYKASTKVWRFYVYDANAGAVWQDWTGTFANAMNDEVDQLDIGNSPFGTAPQKGRYDELFVMPRVMSTAEMDAVIAGTYTGPMSSTTIGLGQMF